jgi:toxin ParE2
MMNIRFLTMAETEVDEAVSWYQEKSEVESLKFLDELDQVVRLVAGYPLIGVEIDSEVRSFVFTRFPYSLIYGTEGDVLVVIAVAHQSRRPRYWADRLTSGES